MEISDLGFDTHFWEQSLDFDPDIFCLARVTAVNRNNFIVRNEKGEVEAELTGKLLFETDSTLEFPTVGDWVLTQYHNENTSAIIHSILPRKSILKRKESGKKIDYQLIAANIDTAFIMQGFDQNFNLSRLERYLVMVCESNIRPLILLSKSDLLTREELELRITESNRLKREYGLIIFSNKTGHGLDEIRKKINEKNTYCLLGSSGVGKTTLLNNLIGKDQFTVNTVRDKDGRGRHTTSKRQLIKLEDGGLIIDTPGMRELGVFGVETGISETFDDIAELESQCRFSDCTHTHEIDCAVLKAVNDGIIDKNRFQNFLKIQKESDLYERSYVANRQRNKKFGKYYKQVIKDKKSSRR